MFKIDKEQSLKIMQEILSHLKSDGQVLYGHTFDRSKFYGDNADCSLEVVPFKHKLAVVELQLDLGHNVNTHVDDYEEAFNQATDIENWNRSTDIEIYYESEIDNDRQTIGLSAYLHSTEAECDVSYPTFTYNEKYQCWMIIDDFWDAPGGINSNDVVTILDFSEYL